MKIHHMQHENDLSPNMFLGDELGVTIARNCLKEVMEFLKLRGEILTLCHPENDLRLAVIIEADRNPFYRRLGSKKMLLPDISKHADSFKVRVVYTEYLSSHLAQYV